MAPSPRIWSATLASERRDESFVGGLGNRIATYEYGIQMNTNAMATPIQNYNANIPLRPQPRRIGPQACPLMTIAQPRSWNAITKLAFANSANAALNSGRCVSAQIEEPKSFSAQNPVTLWLQSYGFIAPQFGGAARFDVAPNIGMGIGDLGGIADLQFFKITEEM